MNYFKKLHWKLTATTLVLFLVAFLFAWNYITPTLEQYFLAQQQENLTVQAEVFSEFIKPYVKDQKYRLVQDYVGKYFNHAIKPRVTVITLDGTVIADSEAEERLLDNHRSRPEVKAALAGQVGKSIRFSKTQQQTLIYVATPIRENGHVMGVVRLDVPMYTMNANINYVKKVMYTSTGVIILLTSFMAFFLANRFTRPIRELQQITERIAEGDFSQKVYITSDDEIGMLAKTITYMANRLRFTIDSISTEQHRLRAVLQSMEDALVAVDTGGRIILMNQSAEQLFWQKESEYLGKYILRLVRNYEVEAAVEYVLDKGGIATKELRLFPGQRKLHILHATPIMNDQKGIVGAVIIFRDVTEIRQLEQLRQEFVANVSHELKTPLTSIKGYVETLLDGALEDKGICQRFLGIIAEEAERLARLINDILNLAKIESVEEETADDTQVVVLAKVASKLEEILSQLAQQKNIQLSWKLQPEDLQVAMEQSYLEQVLINLVENAIKYTLPGGKVSVTFYGAPNSTVIHACVEDTGIGIPEEALARVFERFYRVDKARSREMGGTGLGLSIVKHALEHYGQRIQVSSEVGKGSKFTFTLPRA